MIVILSIIGVIVAVALIVVIVVIGRTRKGLRGIRPGHLSGLRTVDNRIFIKIGDKAKGISSILTDSIPKDCKCAGCKKYRQWLKESR